MIKKLLLKKNQQSYRAYTATPKDWKEKGKKYGEAYKKFEKYLEKKENDVVLNKIKEEIKLMLYNKRTMIENQSII